MLPRLKTMIYCRISFTERNMQDQNVSFISNFRLKWSSITEKLRSQGVKGKKTLIPYKNTLI